MNLEFIQDLWDKDSIIDNELLHNESTKIPALHAKYYRIYNNILTLKKSQETQTTTTRRAINPKDVRQQLVNLNRPVTARNEKILATMIEYRLEVTKGVFDKIEHLTTFKKEIEKIL